MKNLLKRTATALVFAALMIGCILWCKWSFAILFSVIVAIATFEFLRLTMGKSYLACQVLTIINAVLIFLVVFLFRANPNNLLQHVGESADSLVIVPLILGLVTISLPLFHKDRKDFKNTAALLYSLLYIALPFSILNFGVFDFNIFNESPYSGTLLLGMFIMVWASDVGAYTFGMLLGQKYGPKLCPDVSPHKSWIGFWGGLVFTVAAAFIIRRIGWFEANVLHTAIFAVVVHVTGVLGDLIESMWKRNAGVKDSGNCIPGHGGMMDRFDSAMIAIPSGIIYLFLANIL
ncbi:MAG: phosphatidate cytidylyltransferase [Bacteroidales bacterium]|nr:phosphatidate cytidylyltransferase [Bacteroidales bacterium]